MRLLLDTHIFLWCIKNDKKLTQIVRREILNASEVYVSSASIWEIAIKTKLKKLDVNVALTVKAITESGFQELPICAYHAAALANLKEIHRDPFDRMLIAQAISEPLTFLTADELLQEYSDLVKVVRLRQK